METLEELALEKPYQLFILNKNGQTPLDICIEDLSISANLEATQDQDEIQKQLQNLLTQTKESKKKVQMSTKIVDES